MELSCLLQIVYQFPIRQVHKPLIYTLVNKLLTITRRNFSKVNMSLSHLPPELFGLILANLFPDEWNPYNNGSEVLNLRTVCRKYLKRIFCKFSLNNGARTYLGCCLARSRLGLNVDTLGVEELELDGDLPLPHV